MIESIHGHAPLLILAPHGGISEDDLLLPSSWPRKGNDLHTADLAREFAAVADASCVVNHGHDRNRLDLNRISQAARADSDFAARITEATDHLLAQHPRITVLVLHGWHIQQKKIDLGVGAKLDAAAEAEAAAGRLTCSAEFVTRDLEALRVTLADSGFETTLGERWPAAHRNNLLQVFRRSEGPEVPSCFAHLRATAEQGRIEAVQVELGAPLRWQGPARRALLDALRERFGAGPARHAPPQPLPPPPPRRSPEKKQATLQLHDEHSGVALLAGMACFPNETIGSRLVAFLPDGRTSIFIGHGTPRGALAIHGYHFDFEGDALRMEFEQLALATSDPLGWMRSERVQAGSSLEEIEIRLEQLDGRVRGSLRVGSQSHAIDAPALTGPMAGRPFGLRPGSRHQFARSDGTAESVELDLEDETAQGVFTLPQHGEITCQRLQTAAALRVAEDGPLLCEFGPARYHFADGRPAAHGIFESITPR